MTDRQRALDGLTLEIANENIGIYPMSVVGGTGAYEKRTERMEGWNECAIAYGKYAARVAAWLESLPIEHKTCVEDLLLDGKLQINLNDDKVTMWVDCSDLFFWGCSDGEDIDFSELRDLVTCLGLTRHGGALWCCGKRNMRPQTAYYKSCIPEAEWCLFDLSGPARMDSDGIGRSFLTAMANIK